MIAALCAAVLAAAAPDFDLIIRGGRVVDGTGNASYRADVAVKQGRIAAIGALADKTAARTIDARGLVVAPGFVDIHNHSDETLLVEGGAESMVRQGVTSMILGEGLSAAPTTAFPDFAAYFAALTRGGIATNVGSYIGSGTVWTAVHGARAGPPTAPELDRMRALVRQAMQQGALGVASSLSGPPGAWIDTDTLVALCEIAGASGGIYSTHNRNEGLGVFDAVAEAIEIGRRAQVPVDIIHLKIAEHTLWNQMPKLVAQIQAARDQGMDVTANVYPYRAGQNDLQTILPPWAHEGGREALLARLADPAVRARMERDIVNGLPGWYNHYTATGSWEGMLLVSLSHAGLQALRGEAHERGDRRIPGEKADGRAVRHPPGQRRLRAHRLLPPRRGGHAVRAAPALRFRRLGWDGGADRRPDGTGQPASALLRDVPARPRTLRARGEAAHAGGRGPQDDLGEHEPSSACTTADCCGRASGRTSPCSTPRA